MDEMVRPRWAEDPAKLAFKRDAFETEEERMAFLDRVIETTQERAEQEGRFEFTDESGKVRGEILIDPETKSVIEVRVAPWINVEATAEKPQEHVYITDEEGEITDKRATRKEARQAGLRYLVATTLIIHDKQILLQRRSHDKQIDPDKLSASAHGVASEIRQIDGTRFENVDNVAAITAALETNEELRHGEAEKPFRVRYWWARHEQDLFDYAKYKKFDDPDTIWMVPQMMYAQGGYPLGDTDNPRTRFLATGFVFSKEKPHIQPDPAEVTSVDWVKASEYAQDPAVTEDMQTVTTDIFDRWIRENPETFDDKKVLKHFLRRALTGR